jgi:hypothetical protein
VPKLKTHEKVGITVGLKGFVGCVGHKDCLAHHRFGPPSNQGDEYPESGRWRVWLSALHEIVYRRQYPRFLDSWLEVADRNARRLARLTAGRVQAGAWHGNDTAWRMALDLAKIVHFANRAGKLTEKRQRAHLSIIDGIIGGEGEGPLSPRAVKSGVLIFSDNVVTGDHIACRLMGFAPKRVPLVRGALDYEALAGGAHEFCVVDGQLRDVAALSPILGRAFVAPSGWQDALQ